MKYRLYTVADEKPTQVLDATLPTLIDAYLTISDLKTVFSNTKIFPARSRQDAKRLLKQEARSCICTECGGTWSKEPDTESICGDPNGAPEGHTTIWLPGEPDRTTVHAIILNHSLEEDEEFRCENSWCRINSKDYYAAFLAQFSGKRWGELDLERAAIRCPRCGNPDNLAYMVLPIGWLRNTRRNQLSIRRDFKLVPVAFQPSSFILKQP